MYYNVLKQNQLNLGKPNRRISEVIKLSWVRLLKKISWVILSLTTNSKILSYTESSVNLKIFQTFWVWGNSAKFIQINKLVRPLMKELKDISKLKPKFLSCFFFQAGMNNVYSISNLLKIFIELIFLVIFLAIWHNWNIFAISSVLIIGTNLLASTTTLKKLKNTLFLHKLEVKFYTVC